MFYEERIFVCPWCGKIYRENVPEGTVEYINKMCDSCENLYVRGITGQYIN